MQRTFFDGVTDGIALDSIGTNDSKINILATAVRLEFVFVDSNTANSTYSE